MALYAATIFLGAFLLFQVQPIVARYILPWYGGSPAVWTTCMLFFQSLLLVGYLYAHLVGTRLDSRRQAAVHLGLLLLAVALLPITPGAGWKPVDPTLADRRAAPRHRRGAVPGGGGVQPVAAALVYAHRAGSIAIPTLCSVERWVS